jgi:hypothetical protein
MLEPPVNVAFSFLDFPQAKLVRYICKQRQCKLSVAPSDRTAELNSYPRFSDWLYTFNVRPEVVQVLGGLRPIGTGQEGPMGEHSNLRANFTVAETKSDILYLEGDLGAGWRDSSSQQGPG